MSHVLLRSTATPDVGSAPSAVGSAQHSPTRVLVKEQEVAFVDSIRYGRGDISTARNDRPSSAGHNADRRNRPHPHRAA
jgi:hypothetical protein